MFHKLKNIVVSGLIVLGVLTGVGAATALQSPQAAASAKSEIQKGVKQVNDGNNTDLTDFIQTIINVLLFIIGVVSVIMIIYGGFRFVTSGGSAESVKAGKNTILYAIVGLVVAALAFAVVNFVVDKL